MKTKKVIYELKEALAPYMFFWPEWLADENCNLTVADIALAKLLIKNDFKLSLSAYFHYYHKTDQLQHLTRKLQIGYQVFKELVIADFLFAILKLAKAYGHHEFLSTPIPELHILNEIKNCLETFKARTLGQLFIVYKADDFSRGWVYKNIVAFTTAKKELEVALIPIIIPQPLILTNKTMLPMTK